jgi:hypothetical protein
MGGSVQQAVRSSVRPGERLPTPTGTAHFVVDKIDSTGVTLLFGPKRTPTFFDWDCLEGVVGYMKGRDWVAVGANRVLAGNPDTLDGYLKQHVPRQTANYIAVLLSQAGVLDLDDGRPARVRLSAEWSTT